MYLHVSWQPLPVRLGQKKEVTPEHIQRACETMGARLIQVDIAGMEDTRMQNMALLGSLAKYRVIPGLVKKNYHDALTDLLAGDLLEKNRAVFDGYAEDNQGIYHG
jgi:indolepyruvate ferredoxin oxidoreductase beta subunit